MMMLSCGSDDVLYVVLNNYAARMISQSVTFPQALWEGLLASRSHKAYGNYVVTKVVGTSVSTKVMRMLYL